MARSTTRRRQGGHWQVRALATIEDQLRAWCRARGVQYNQLAELVSTMGKGNALELFNRVNAAYPFGQRSGWPYRVWLKEMQSLRQHLGLIPRRRVDFIQRKREKDRTEEQLEFGWEESGPEPKL